MAYLLGDTWWEKFKIIPLHPGMRPGSKMACCSAKLVINWTVHRLMCKIWHCVVIFKCFCEYAGSNYLRESEPLWPSICAFRCLLDSSEVMETSNVHRWSNAYTWRNGYKCCTTSAWGYKYCSEYGDEWCQYQLPHQPSDISYQPFIISLYFIYTFIMLNYHLYLRHLCPFHHRCHFDYTRTCYWPTY